MGALMVMEVSKKQHYIFKSRKLKNQIGASSIIRYVTENLFEENGPLNMASYGGKLAFKGGGKSLFEFESLQQAKTFVKVYSTAILKDYPGVDLFMSCVPYDSKKDPIINVIATLFEKLALKKGERQNAFYQMDYGVNMICKESKLPVNHMSYKGQEKVSREIAKKVDIAMEIGKKSIKYNFFDSLLPENTKYIDDLQNSTLDKKNMLAIVHIDGNSMGKRILTIRDHYKDCGAEKNEAYLDALNEFSQDVDESYKKAFEEMLEAIKDKLKSENQNSDCLELPIRPLILAGDDICFVVQGAYGVECSRVFLECLYNKKDSQGNPYTGCAGIAIVKNKYPFFKAYELAEELCSNAKKILAKNDLEASAMDWHLNFGELSGGLGDIREENYLCDEDKRFKLYRRPYILDTTLSELKAISAFKYSDFEASKQMVDNVKAKSRNLLKSMRNAIKEGPTATAAYAKVHRNIDQYLMEDEFEREASRSFDVIEIMDVFEKLEG